MKVRLCFDLDSINEAEEILATVKHLKEKPYQMKGFGPPIITGDVKTMAELEADDPVGFCNSGFEEQVKATQPRKNLCPGDPTIGKIGEATKATILGDLDACQKLPKYTEHLKLLWARQLLKFDGKEYYLP